MTGAIKMAERVVDERENAYMLQQIESEANPEVHYRTTGPEMWQDTDGTLDILVAGVPDLTMSPQHPGLYHELAMHPVLCRCASDLPMNPQHPGLFRKLGICPVTCRCAFDSHQAVCPK